MAVAGINNVSVLESSYFANQDKPITRTSFIRKLWRDLDDETKNRETERKQTNVNSTGSRCSCSSEGAESEAMSTITSEAENECPLNQNACLQQSLAIGSADKERVRRVFREWGSKNVNNNGLAFNVSHNNNNNNNNISNTNNNCSRARLVCDTESMRVRTVRQWLESNTQQAETCQSPIDEQDGLGFGQTCVGARKSIRLLYGRHALLDLLTRFQLERKKELQSLLESQPVSTFAHRKRIKALLKGRFLLNQRFVQDEKPTSTAVSELGYLRQSQTVSDLRKGFLSRVNSNEQTHDGPHSDTSSYTGMKYQENQVHEDINESDTFSENGTNDQENQVPEDTVDESDTSSENDIKYLENQPVDDTVNDNESERQQPPPPPQPSEPLQQTLELKCQYESGGDELELEVDQTFDHLNASETASETGTDILFWQGELVEAEDNLTLTNVESTQSQNENSVENQDDWMYQENVHDGWYDDNHPVVTTDAFYIPDDDNDNNTRVELQRLTSRRRVSNLLQSGFRVRLNQVLQSYLARQHQASESDEDWMLESEHQEDENDEVDESTEIGYSWQQHPEINQQSGTDLEIINGLRMDLVMLQERMNSMQNTLQTCMKMQLELQRSVQQEVSSALNRSPNSGEESLQSCFLCCDSGFDSSPDRRGHVYVCANCAEKINWSKVKESVRHP